MLSQEIDIKIKMGLHAVSKPINIPIVSKLDRIKKSGSFCINIDDKDKIEESINEDIYDYINMPNNDHEYFDIDYKNNSRRNNSRRNDDNRTNIIMTNNNHCDNSNTRLKDYNNYSLDTICFDPTKFSPPDEWSLRLKHRIRNYEANESTLYVDYLFDNK